MKHFCLTGYWWIFCLPATHDRLCLNTRFLRWKTSEITQVQWSMSVRNLLIVRQYSLCASSPKKTVSAHLLVSPCRMKAIMPGGMSTTVAAEECAHGYTCVPMWHWVEVSLHTLACCQHPLYRISGATCWIGKPTCASNGAFCAQINFQHCQFQLAPQLVSGHNNSSEEWETDEGYQAQISAQVE